MFKFVKYQSVEALKQANIKNNREKILVNKREKLGLKADEVAKQIGISRQAYTAIETNYRTGLQYMNEIKSILSLNDEEMSLISSYHGNIIDDAKEYALKIAKEYVNDIDSIATTYKNTHTFQNDERYLASIYLSLFFHIHINLKKPSSKPDLKNIKLINDEILNWLTDNFTFLNKNINPIESLYLSKINEDLFNDFYNDWTKPILNSTNEDYIELRNQIENEFNQANITPNAYFKNLINNLDVKSSILNDLGFSSSYLAKLQGGYKPFSDEVIYRLAQAINITLKDASLLTGSIEQELVSTTIENEYYSILNNIPENAKRLITLLENKLTMGLELCYQTSITYNTFLCSKVTGKCSDFVLLELFLSFLGIQIEYSHPIKVSNKNECDTNINIYYQGEYYVMSIFEFEKKYNDFLQLNNKIYTKFFKFINRKN